MLKNRIHAIVIKENLKFLGKDMFGTKGRLWVKEQKLSEGKRQVVDLYLAQLEKTESSIGQIEEIIKQRSSSIPEVKLLQTIPGFGTTTAFLLASEIGEIKRFPNSKKFASYFSMVPRLSQSGNHAYYGRITKLGNPYVRWYLVQAAHRMYRMDSNYRKFVDRISYKAGKKKAIVALARELATVVYAILRDNRKYTEEKPKVCPAIIPE